MRGRVLIVDDEADVLASTAMVVESLGYEVHTVSDPAEILDTIARVQPDVVLQDLRMPGLNLAGLVASLRTHPGTATLPLVFFSANVDVSSIAARYDAWGHLSKPFTADQLASVLTKVLGKAPAAAVKRDPEREVRDVFHDHWNLLSALANYAAILDRAGPMTPEARKAVEGLQDTLLKLESKTDRLRASALAWAGLANAPAANANPANPPPNPANPLPLKSTDKPAQVAT